MVRFESLYWHGFPSRVLTALTHLNFKFPLEQAKKGRKKKVQSSLKHRASRRCPQPQWKIKEADGEDDTPFRGNWRRASFSPGRVKVSVKVQLPGEQDGSCSTVTISSQCFRCARISSGLRLLVHGCMNGVSIFGDHHDSGREPL